MPSISKALIRGLSALHRLLALAFGSAFGWLGRVLSHVPVPLRVAGCFLLMGLVAFALGRFVPGGYVEWAGLDAAQQRLLELSGELGAGARLALGAKGVVLACAAAALLGFVPSRLVYRLLQAVAAAWTLLVLAALRFAFAAPAAMCAADYKVFDKLSRNALWTAALGAATPVVILAALVLLLLALTTVRRRYGIGRPGFGDRIVDSLRTGGTDRRWRTSWYWSTGLFVSVIVAPFIFRGCSFEEPYGLVPGSGEPEVQVVKIKKIKREKKKKFILNAWSPYIFTRAKLDDLKTFDEMMEQTQDEYVANQPTKKKLGKGRGKTGGWPNGMEGAKVRFIRLEYAGGDWDQDMGKGADYNLLLKFHELTGFPIARETESKRVAQLARFPKHQAPPFVFLTGSRGLNLSGDEIKALRKYLTDEGGLLFIDNGGGQFGRAVRSLVSRVFPDKPFIDIPNDDPIYQKPFLFPDGAPPFWHHDGTRAKGVRIGDRLAVYYHPGDINDAWKDGHSGASGEVAAQAYRLGINVMYYAFNAYYERHFGGGKDE